MFPFSALLFGSLTYQLCLGNGLSKCSTVAHQHHSSLTQVRCFVEPIYFSAWKQTPQTHQQHPKVPSWVPAPGTEEERQKVSPLNTQKVQKHLPHLFQ